MSEAANLQEIATTWRRSRRIYAVFVALDQKFKLGMGACSDLDCPIDRADPEALERVRKWIEDCDSRCNAAQLRQLFQSQAVATEENLRTLLKFYIEKEKHSDADREKTDFLLVHYFSFCAPVAMQEGEPTLDDFAAVVEPVLGECSTIYPSWLERLKLLAEKLSECDTLQDLVELDIIDKARELKKEASDRYFATSALLAFAHYNFLARRSFFRLLHSDLITIRAALIELENRGVTWVDCLAAGMTDRESIANLNKVVRDWKRVFEGDYSRGYNFLSLAGLRLALQAALERSVAAPVESPSEPVIEIVDEPAREPEVEQAVEDPVLEVAPEPLLTLEKMLSRVGTELEKNREELSRKNLATAKISLDGLELVLASWEVSAYLSPSPATANGLQSAVAARAALTLAMDPAANNPALLNAAISIAQLQGAQLQEQVAQARERSDIDSAVNLAASGKRLSSLLEQAKKLQGTEVKA